MIYLKSNRRVIVSYTDGETDATDWSLRRDLLKSFMMLNGGFFFVVIVVASLDYRCIIA